MKAPYMLVPKGGKKVAARIARDFVTLIEGFTERYNELSGTQLDPAQGLTTLLDSNIEPNPPEAFWSSTRRPIGGGAP